MLAEVEPERLEFERTKKKPAADVIVDHPSVVPAIRLLLFTGESSQLYLRVSGNGQVDGDGFPRQRETIARYTKAAGFELVGEYRDEGVSGTKDLDDREGLSDLLARIRSNGVRVVLVELRTGSRVT